MSASRPGNGHASIGRCKSLKRAYAKPSKRLHHLPLRHQRTPSNKQHRPAEEKQTCHRLKRQKQASDLLYWKGGLNAIRQAQLPK